MPLTLIVYDLSTPFINSLLFPLSHGFYHTTILFNGYEYSYGSSPEGCGIYKVEEGTKGGEERCRIELLKGDQAIDYSFFDVGSEIVKIINSQITADDASDSRGDASREEISESSSSIKNKDEARPSNDDFAHFPRVVQGLECEYDGVEYNILSKNCGKLEA